MDWDPMRFRWKSQKTCREFHGCAVMNHGVGSFCNPAQHSAESDSFTKVQKWLGSWTHSYCHLLCMEKVLVFIVSHFKLIAINCRNVYLSSSCRQTGKSQLKSSAQQTTWCDKDGRHSVSDSNWVSPGDSDGCWYSCTTKCHQHASGKYRWVKQVPNFQPS